MNGLAKGPLAAQALGAAGRQAQGERCLVLSEQKEREF